MNQSFFKDKSGKVVLMQPPNLTIIGWAISTIISKLTHSQLIAWIGSAFLVVWALQELFSGVNYFRRLLGLIVLGFLINSYLR